MSLGGIITSILDLIRGYILRNAKIGPLTKISKKSIISNSIIGRKCLICQQTELYDSTFDDYSTLGRNSIIWNTAVGKYCSIGGGVKINLSGHPVNYFSTHPFFYRARWFNNGIVSNLYQQENSACTLGHDVWLGENVLVLSGITIGTGAIVGANSLVTRDIPPYAVAVGTPAKVVRYRFDVSTIDKLTKSQWWNAGEEELKNILHHIKDDSSILTNPDTLISLLNRK